MLTKDDEGDTDDDDVAIDIFQEPQDYFPPEKPCSQERHQLRNGSEITLRLVGHSPLWGHLLWNAGRAVAYYLEDHALALVENKRVLELGAGAGLPSLVCAILGARTVVATDFPDADLIENLRHNLSSCTLLPSPSHIQVEGYVWGAPVDLLQAHVSTSTTIDSSIDGAGKRFDLLVLADVLFNHSEHVKLLHTVRSTLARTADARALVFFTPYRPWLLEKDLNFLELAKVPLDVDNDKQDTYSDGIGAAFIVRQVTKQELDNLMFPDDQGRDDDPVHSKLRRTVFGYELMWQDLQHAKKTPL